MIHSFSIEFRKYSRIEGHYTLPPFSPRRPKLGGRGWMTSQLDYREKKSSKKLPVLLLLYYQLIWASSKVVNDLSINGDAIWS